MSVMTIVLVSVALCVAVFGAALGAEMAVVIPPPALDNPKVAGPLQTAVVAGGCFWGVQGVYQHVRGVRKVLSGYAGGTKATADYEMVSRGGTGHAESVEIVFDPKELSYGEVLQIYFSVAHDPTQLNRQGPDTGTQYRSNIFYSDESQQNIAQAYIAQLARTKAFGREIVTGRSAEGLLPGGGLSPGFSDQQPALSLHRVQRPAEDRESEEGVPRSLSGAAGAGQGLQVTAFSSVRCSSRAPRRRGWPAHGGRRRRQRHQAA